MIAVRRADARQVWIFHGQKWQQTPRFHIGARWDDGGHVVTQTDVEDGLVRVEHRALTLCGRSLSTWGWTLQPGRTRDYTSRDFADAIRRDHAELIGQPCSRCLAAERAT